LFLLVSTAFAVLASFIFGFLSGCIAARPGEWAANFGAFGLGAPSLHVTDLEYQKPPVLFLNNRFRLSPIKRQRALANSIK
jgi:hypothetical protein